VNEEQDGGSSRKAKVRGSSGKAIDAHIGRLHYQVTYCSREGYDLGSL